MAGTLLVHEIGRIDGGKVFQNIGNMFQIGGNMCYDQKNKIPIKNFWWERGPEPE